FSAYDKVDSGKYKNNVNFLKNQYDNFITSAQTTTGIQYDQASNSFKTTIDFKVTDPKFSIIAEGSDVKLDEDDLFQEMIKKEIIDDITNGKYKLYISDLLKMLEDKANYSSMSEDQKVEFVAKYFLGGDKAQALEIVQSLDFLLVYKDNGLSTASKDKFENNGFSIKNEILNQVNNTSANIKNKLSKIETDLKSLVENSNNSLNELLVKQKELDGVIKAYNAYVNLINKNLASKNDSEFIALKNQIDILTSESQILANLINSNQEKLSTWQNINNTESFKVAGAFANVILINPQLNQITGEGGDGEDPNKPDLPKQDLEFEQISTLNLIGDNALDIKEDSQNVEETALKQKGKTCIVSDNFKSMNPCVVEGI
ncbi:TPA: hypothetical protein RXM13_001572, partial [Campylobacter coli]|nr:hypothetical protein [Campylobacter coli]